MQYAPIVPIRNGAEDYYERVMGLSEWLSSVWCCLWWNAELPLVEAVVNRVNISEGARAVLKCRIKSSPTDTDIDIRWFHNASPVNTAAGQFAVHQSMYTINTLC